VTRAAGGSAGDVLEVATGDWEGGVVGTPTRDAARGVAGGGAAGVAAVHAPTRRANVAVNAGKISGIAGLYMVERDGVGQP
jgi:hypothetical protein